MGRVQEGVRRTTESGPRGEGTGEARLFDMSVSEVTLLLWPGSGGGRAEEREAQQRSLHNDATSAGLSSQQDSEVLRGAVDWGGGMGGRRGAKTGGPAQGRRRGFDVSIGKLQYVAAARKTVIASEGRGDQRSRRSDEHTNVRGEGSEVRRRR